MTVSEPLATLPRWQVPTQAFARWTVLLMGWVWLGQQGQRLSWSLASGLLVVALWWAVRLVLQRQTWGRLSALPRGVALALGLATAVSAIGIAQAPPSAAALGGLLVLAVVWAFWSHALERQAQPAARCQRPWAGWPPLLAAAATWFTLGGPSFVAGLVLLGAAGMAHIGASKASEVVHPRRESLAESIPGVAMGWMMGSLWLSNAWCVGAGWSSDAVVGMHLVFMAVLPACIRMAWLPRHLPAPVNRSLPLLFVALGAALLWGDTAPANGIVGMLFLALAWALPQRASVNPHQAQAGQASRAAHWAPLLGPAALIAVGHWSPMLGPQALALAFLTLGLIACAVVAQDLWRHRSNTGMARLPRL